MSCTICTEGFQQSRQPKVLSCGHTFCVMCIGEWFTAQREQYNTPCNSVKCPVCRRKTTLPAVESGVASLPTNFALLEAVEETRETLAVAVCDDDVSKRTCPTHAGKLLEYLCETCDGKLVCGQCVKSQHQPAAGHRIASFLTIVKREQNEKAELQRKVLELQQTNSELALNNYANLKLEEPDRQRTNCRGTVIRRSSGTQETVEKGTVLEDTTGAFLDEIQTIQSRLRPVSAVVHLSHEHDDTVRRPLSASPLTRTGSLPAARFQNESRQPSTLPSTRHELENRILAGNNAIQFETTLRANGITADSVPDEMVPKGTVPWETVPEGTVTDNTTVVLLDEIQRVHTRLRPVSVSVHLSQEQDSQGQQGRLVPSWARTNSIPTARFKEENTARPTQPIVEDRLQQSDSNRIIPGPSRPVSKLSRNPIVLPRTDPTQRPHARNQTPPSGEADDSIKDNGRSVATPKYSPNGLRSRCPPKPAPRPRSIAGHQLVGGVAQSQGGCRPSWQPPEHSDGRPISVLAPRPISVLAPRNPPVPSGQSSNSNDETDTDYSLSARDKLARVLQLSLNRESQP